MDLQNIKYRLTKARKLLFKLFFFAQYFTKRLFFQIKRRAPLLKKLHLESFPAIHLNKMDWMDFTLKFAGELLVLVLALMVVGLNLFYFGGAKDSVFKDFSLASVFLNRHTQLNPKLYAKNSQVVTVVSSGGLFPTALADDFAGLDNLNLAAYSAEYEDENLLLGNESTILAPNPDSVQSLIEKQIQVYQTQSGDTLGSVAQKFGISQQTIIWANNLPSNLIKPGWYLLVLPVDGVAVKADSNDTLPDIAAKYNPQRYNTDKKIRDEAAEKLLDKIISYNALENAEDIDGGQVIIVPGGAITQAPAAPRPVTQPKPTGSGASDVVTSIGSGYDGIGHIFPKGYCTWYVASRMKITFGGNAKNWLANAKSSGYVVKGPSEPSARTAVVTTDDKRFGHVALVEEVTDTAIFVTEMNFVGFNKISQRWIPRNSKTIRGYIYP